MNVRLGVTMVVLVGTMLLAAGPGGAAQRAPSPRYCAAEAGQGRFPAGCPQPAQRPGVRSQPAPHAPANRPLRRRTPAQRQAYLSLIDFLNVAQGHVLCQRDGSLGSNRCRQILGFVDPEMGRITLHFSALYLFASNEDARVKNVYGLPYLPNAFSVTHFITYEVSGRGRLCSASSQPYLRREIVRVIYPAGVGQSELTGDVRERFLNDRNLISATPFYAHCVTFRRVGANRIEMIGSGQDDGLVYEALPSGTEIYMEPRAINPLLRR